MEESVYDFVTLNRNPVCGSWELDVSGPRNPGCERLPEPGRKDDIQRGAYHQGGNARQLIQATRHVEISQRLELLHGDGWGVA